MKPFFIYAVSALFIMTAESGAPGLPVEKETVPANDRYRNKSYAISLRWHYPNQVPGLDDTVHSQPAANQLPFFSFSIVKLSGMCVKVQGKVQGTETKGPSPNAGFMLSKTFPIGETI